jgi:hypothetical protein
MAEEVKRWLPESEMVDEERGSERLGYKRGVDFWRDLDCLAIMV